MSEHGVSAAEHGVLAVGQSGDSRSDGASSAAAGEYVVVARRYRPRRFDELVGQEHVAQALSGAITSHRVGHAYLFTGARGVGKTSAARILAKALNCVKGPAPDPCNACDSCQGVAAGSDIDVLEIDGASNRGIDEMRELRQNVSVRPSRSRFKVYIIDEVHMLTEQAFNALLKTLEEPPEHVKFVFCTTEPEKIPITVLSRCQRFDFAGVQTSSISRRLAQIAAAEGVEAEPAALEALARRAAGSMRDSQSLLEQLLAFGGQSLTLADVERMLGTAGDRRLGQLSRALVDRQPAEALAQLDQAVTEGVDVGPLLDQLLGYFRDCLVAAVGAAPETFRYTSPAERDAIVDIGRNMGAETLLAVMGILEQTSARMRTSVHGRILMELAVVRICQLEDLAQLSSLVAQLRDGGGQPAGGSVRAPTRALAAPPVTGGLGSGGLGSGGWAGAAQAPAEPKKKAPDGPVTGDLPDQPSREISPSTTSIHAGNAPEIWKQVVLSLEDMLLEPASLADSVAISAPNRLVVLLPARYTSVKSNCERPEQMARLEQALRRLTGQEFKIQFELAAAPAPSGAAAGPVGRPVATARERLAESARRPLVKRAIEVFDARPFRIEP